MNNKENGYEKDFRKKPGKRLYSDEEYDDYGYEDDDYEYEYDEYSSGFDKKKKIKILSMVVAVIVLLFVCFFGFKMYQTSAEVKKAEKLVQIGNYDEAEAIYSNLYMKTGDSKYNTEREKVGVLKENKNHIKDAKSSFESDSYADAIAEYKKIDESDKESYKIAQEGIEEATNKAIYAIEKSIKDGDTYTAKSQYDDLDKVMSGDPRLKKLEDKLNSKEKNTTANGQTIIFKTAGIDNISDDSMKRRVESYSNGIIGTYQSVTAGEANIRTGPSKGSSIITSISRGSTVYVEDIYVESSERIWCKITYGGREGWISYNTMNYTI